MCIRDRILQGAGDEENTDRWGEYAATVIDSSDDLTFYGVGEYYNTSQTGTTNCGLPGDVYKRQSVGCDRSLALH